MPRMVAAPSKKRLLATAQVEHPIGKHVAAFEIAGKLDFVDGEKGSVGVVRQGLDGTHAESRRRRQDLFLAGDQRDLIGADAVGDAAVDLARQQPQWQADNAGRRGQACARWRDGSCRYWSARARQRRCESTASRAFLLI